MNKHEHADHSVQLFGGKVGDYEAIHELIDSNKTVTPSIFGRFFLHHFDIGLIILKKIFGEKVGSKKVPIERVLLQHLFEDYGKVITFKGDWLPVLEEIEEHLPKVDTWEIFTKKASQDKRIRTLTDTQLGELDDFFQLRALPGVVPLTKDESTSFAIFGHALGGDLAARLLGKKFHGIWTNDAVTGYLNCRFSFAERDRDPVPTLLDYERYVPDHSWMHAPTDPLNTKEVKMKIESYLKESKKPKGIDFLKEFDSSKKSSLKVRGTGSFRPHRRPCNLD